MELFTLAVHIRLNETVSASRVVGSVMSLQLTKQNENDEVFELSVFSADYEADTDSFLSSFYFVLTSQHSPRSCRFYLHLPIATEE